MIGFLQWLIVFALSVGALIGGVWGLIDASRYSGTAYAAAGKQTKALWVVLLLLAALVAFISLPYPIGRGDGIIGFLGIASIAVIALYFANVRPALKLHHRPGGTGHGSSRGGW